MSHLALTDKFVLVIHGGAGTMARERSTPEQRARYKAALADALKAGYAVLKAGGEAMDAAVAAVTSMESTSWLCQARGCD
jgi:beta-aspartyl-peptidase (threonine type)